MKSFVLKAGCTRCLLSLAIPPILFGMIALAKWVQPMALSVVFSPDGRFLATASEGDGSRENGGMVTIWDIQAGRRRLLIRSKPAARSVAFSADGSLLAAGLLDGSIVLWDAMTGARKKVLNGGQGPIQFLEFAPGGDRLLSVSFDRAALHDLATPGLKPATVSVDEFEGAAISKDGQRAAIATGFSPPSEQIRLYDISGGDFALVESLSCGAFGLAISDDGSELAMSSRGGRGIEIWKVEPPSRVATLPDPYAGLLALSEHGDALASASFDVPTSCRAVRVWDLAARRPRHTFLGSHDSHFWSVALSPDGRHVAAASSDGSTVVWNAVDGRRLAVVNGNQFFLWSLAAIAACFVLWSIAWLRSGRSLKGRFWPFVDIVLLNGLALAGLLLRQCLAWQAEDVARLPAALAMGGVANMPALLLFWGAFGRSRWQSRLPGVVAGLAATWCIPLTVWRADEAWQHLVCAASFLTCLVLAFESARAGGIRLLRGDPDSQAPGRERPERRQFVISDLLLWITAAALFCGVARFATPHMLAPTGWRLLMLIGLTLAATAIASVWAAFGRTPAPLRILALAGLAVGCGFLDHFVAGPSTTLSWQLWPMALHASLATSIVASLAIIRAYGFRLARQSDKSPAVTA